jgi:hypothetical protein
MNPDVACFSKIESSLIVCRDAVDGGRRSHEMAREVIEEAQKRSILSEELLERCHGRVPEYFHEDRFFDRITRSCETSVVSNLPYPKNREATVGTAQSP